MRIGALFLIKIKDRAGDKNDTEKGMDIERVYLAQDSRYLYVKFDLADGSFNKRENPNYYVKIMASTSPRVEIGLNLFYNKYDRKWECIIDKYEPANDSWRKLSSGTYRISGSSFEARFPLSALSRYINSEEYYLTWALIGYTKNNKWHEADATGTTYIQIQF